MLEALKHLPGVKALIVGDALFSGEKAYGERLKEYCREHGLEDRVSFLGFREDIPALMHLSDVIVHASVNPEPFGRVIVEGMLAGKPVIATRCGGPMEIIDDLQTGVLVSPNDAGGLGGGHQIAVVEPESASHIANRGREKAQAAYSVECMNDRINREIERVHALFLATGEKSMAEIIQLQYM